MNPNDESRLAEHRHAFLRHLPRRVETIGRRLLRFLQNGWDINGLALIHDDAAWLGPACERHGLESAAGHFRQLQQLLGQTLAQQELPDPALGERLWHLIEDIGETVPMAAEPSPASPAGRAAHAGRGETPPANYWRRWGDDAPPATYGEPAATLPAATPAMQEPAPVL